jgi:hypothetical protein
MPKKRHPNMLDAAVVHLVREICRDSLGFNATFVDDDVMVLAGLAQRAVLAGLDSDCKPQMRARFKEAAEKYREQHEFTLGYPITVLRGQKS